MMKNNITLGEIQTQNGKMEESPIKVIYPAWQWFCLLTALYTRDKIYYVRNSTNYDSKYLVDI